MTYRDPEKQREYQRNWIAKRRSQWLEENGPCVVCGSWEDLEVDHVDRHQKIDHKVWSWRRQRRLEELAKCQVLCQKHHLEKSRQYGDRAPAAHHGTVTMYKRNGCRCADCRQAKSIHFRQYRQRRKLRQAAYKKAA